MVLLRRFELLLLAEPGFEPGVSAISPQELGWLRRIELPYSPSQGVALPLSYSQQMVTLAGFEPALDEV